MYKVIIVDDEPIIRLGVKACIPWEDGLYGFAGEYANGVEALKAIEAQEADILITDIKMPLMDGLTLTRKALELRPGLKVILVSSHNDFDFVRQGIRLGAKDYILKHTLEPEELKEVLGRCVESLARERMMSAGLDLLHHSEKEKNRKQLEHEFKRTLSALSVSHAGSASISWLPQHFQEGCSIASVLLNDVEELEQKYGDIYLSIVLEEMQEIVYELFQECIAVPVNHCEMALLIPGARLPEGEIDRLHQRLEAHTGKSVTIGCHPQCDPEHLPEGLQFSKRACERRFYEGSGGIFVTSGQTANELPGYRPETADFRGRLQEAFAAGDRTRIEVLIEQRIRMWEARCMEPGLIRAEACEIVTGLFVQQADMAELLAMYQQINKTETLKQVVELILGHMQECVSARGYQGQRKDSNQTSVDQALDFIHKNYTGELALQAVADHVHISKNYFCILFKKYTNYSFIDYVIQLRIRKAKELLTAGDMKIYEVAERSGFNDVKYFSKLFKRITGRSPAEFRESNESIA